LVLQPCQGIGVLATNCLTGLQAVSEALPQDGDCRRHVTRLAVCRIEHCCVSSPFEPRRPFRAMLEPGMSPAKRSCQILFTRSCAEVKLAPIAAQHVCGDLPCRQRPAFRPAYQRKGTRTMLRKMLSWGSREIEMEAGNENLPETTS